MSAEHTPTPWAEGDWPYITAQEGGRSIYICEMTGSPSNPRAVADRALIVRAVNAHASLEGRGEQCDHEWLDRIGGIQCGSCGEQIAARTGSHGTPQTDALLAALEGEGDAQ